MRRTWFLLIMMISLITTPVLTFADSESISLNVGECKVLSIPGLTRVSTSIPDVIEVVVTGGNEILLNAKKTGLSVVNIWTPSNRYTYRISVQEDFSAIESDIARLINNPNVQVRVNQKFVILSGTVKNSLEALEAVQYAKMYRDNIINNLNVQTKYQVLLTILVTEIKADAQKKYGMRWGNWITTDGETYTFKESQWNYIEGNKNSIIKFPSDRIGAQLDLMQRNGDAKILAAPSILTVSGQEAQFMAGGEIPVPISDGTNGTKVEWKEYGVKLKVTPIIGKDDTITMSISPEVSSIDWANAVLLGGDKIPALTSRKATTTVQYKDGATLVIGGLLKKEDSLNVVKMPILGDLPIIGSLFRSKDFQNGNTELLLFVTPRIIKNDMNVDQKTITAPSEQGPYFNQTEK